MLEKIWQTFKDKAKSVGEKTKKFLFVQKKENDLSQRGSNTWLLASHITNDGELKSFNVKENPSTADFERVRDSFMEDVNDENGNVYSFNVRVVDRNKEPDDTVVMKSTESQLYKEWLQRD